MDAQRTLPSLERVLGWPVDAAARSDAAAVAHDTSHTKRITLVASRSKPHLQDVARAYYAQRDGKSSTPVMITRLRKDTSGWYKLLLTYLCSSPEDADVRMLDAAMDGGGRRPLGSSDLLDARRG